MSGITYISTPRPGAKRGGGAAIAFNPERFSVSKLNIHIPKPLEIVWALMRPVEPIGDIRKIILCSFYSPPNSRKNNLLVDHISVTYNSLKIQHPNAATLISGDKNSLDERNILALNPSFHQIVSRNTRNNKILTILITDLPGYYHVPQVIPPVPVDVPGHGVPSDHNGVLAVPLSSANSQRKAETSKMTVRPLPDSLVCKFGSILVQEDWSFLAPNLSSTELVNLFEKHTSKLVESTFPEKTVTISDRDQPFMTENLKLIRRQRIRAYRKNGQSAKYLELQARFDQKMKEEAKKYHQKILDEVAEGKRSNSYTALRKLEFGYNDSRKSTFTLPSHAEDNLSPTQSAERLAEYFSQISQEFEPISTEKFPPWIKEKLLAGKTDKSKPFLEDWQVYKKLLKSKKPNSLIPGDLPVKLVKEFTPELAKPTAVIFNQITHTAEYPLQWVIEYQLPIPRIYLNFPTGKHLAISTFLENVWDFRTY